MEADVSVQYRNMKGATERRPEALGMLYSAAEKLGMRLESRPIRGGTDGAALAAFGIASPNIFTGAHNLHSKKEWIALEAMESSLSLVMGIIREAAR